MSFLASLEKKSRLFKILLGFALIGATGIIDFLTGYELSFSLFYVIPISLVTWLIGRRHGILISLASAFVWLWADVASGHHYEHPLYHLWNALIRLSFFLIITLLLSELKNALEREKDMAQTDYLTGAVNARLFFKLVQMEVDRFCRTKR
ncbi:MAG TPA: hypothetical protein VIJ25_13965, partial [Methylococcales bacterium]